MSAGLGATILMEDIIMSGIVVQQINRYRKQVLCKQPIEIQAASSPFRVDGPQPLRVSTYIEFS